MSPRIASRLGFGALLLAAAPAGAQNRSLDLADLALVFAAYVETVVELRGHYAVCAPSQPDRWDEGAAVLTASLRGAGVAETAVSRLEASLAAPVSSAGIDCGGAAVAMRAGVPDGQDWETFHAGALDKAGVAVVRPGTGDSKLEAARAAVQAAMPAQARMLACLSIFDPQGFVLSYRDWDELIGRLDDLFAAAGHPPQVYVPILQVAVSERLFDLPSPRAEVTASCAADESWARRAYGLEWYALIGEVERALKGEAP